METSETTTTEKPEGEFLLTKREHVEWALGKIAALEAEERLIQAQAEKALKRIRADRESFTGRFLPQIDSWTRGELERTKSKRRSIVSRPSARVGRGSVIRTDDMSNSLCGEVRDQNSEWE